MPRLAELNREIRTAEARLADLDRAIKPSAAASFNGAAMDAHAAVSRELDELQCRKTAILAGEGDPAERKPAPVIKKPTIIRSRPAAIDTPPEGWVMKIAREKFSAENLKKPASQLFVMQMLDLIVVGIAKQNADLKQRVAELEERPEIVDAGLWKGGAEYRRGQGVTRHGSFFICQVATTTAVPGQSNDWRLSVKRGREGKSVDLHDVERLVQRHVALAMNDGARR